ncbi:MAG: hypothetical protein ACI4MH_02475 [Candidatus Coproplasma sp.]
MKIAVIDVGSNSVRLMMWADGKTLYKKLNTTRLGEGLNATGALSAQAIERTAQAVDSFIREARFDGAQEVYAFATAAVRSSVNGGDFVERVRRLSGLEVDVISGEKEAEIGLSGALGGADGGIIDVGGASTEITVCDGGKVLFTKSVNVGTVRIHDAADRDRPTAEKFIAGRIAEYGEHDFSKIKMYAIGGTASRLAAVKHGIKVYTPSVSNGTTLSVEEVGKLAHMLLTLPIEEIRATTICTTSADVVGGGALLLYEIMKKFRIAQITVSESDNLEGYAAYIGQLKENK